MHGNAPVISKRGLHAQKLAETMTFFTIHSPNKAFEDKRKSIAQLFFVPSLQMHLILPKEDIAQGSHCLSRSPILYVWLKTIVTLSPPT